MRKNSCNLHQMDKNSKLLTKRLEELYEDLINVLLNNYLTEL